MKVSKSHIPFLNAAVCPNCNKNTIWGLTCGVLIGFFRTGFVFPEMLNAHTKIYFSVRLHLCLSSGVIYRQSCHYPMFVCLFVCLTGRPCGTRLGPGGPDSSKSLSQATSVALTRMWNFTELGFYLIIQTQWRIWNRKHCSLLLIIQKIFERLYSN